MKIKRIGIVANIEKEKIADHVKSLKKWLENKGLAVFLGTEISQKIALGGGLKWDDLARKSQLVVVLGGDGTMLRTARYVAEYKVPILGINMGGLGYLTEVNLNEMHSALELIISGKFTAEKRMMLNVSIKHGKTVTNVGEVLNDVVINRGSLSRMNELEMEVNGTYLTTYKGDGLIVSTPTGSTAYSLSAGGPIVFPGKDLIIINPICPHTLTNRPIIFSEDSNLKITLWSKDNGAVLTLDGQDTYRITSGDVVTVKKSKQVTMLIISPYRSHAEILRSKLGWGDLPPGARKRKMLNELSIKNFAIIDELHVCFGEGLNVISGETGAGKSIIIGAVSLLLGDRATSDMIRTQADTATVEALFDITQNKPLQDKIAAMGFSAADELLIRRVISHAGKNKAFINGQMATLANLAAVSELLINICGQHEHQVILNAENHIDILDEFGGCLSARAAYTEIYNQYQQIRSQIEKLKNLSRSREEKADLFKFQLKEIQDINPQPSEDAALADEKKVLVNFQRLSGWAGNAYDLLYGEKDSAIVKLKEVQNQVKEIKKIDPNLKITEEDIESSFITLQEAALQLRDYGKNLFFDSERLAAIDERLEHLNSLKRKYGGSLEGVLHRKQEIEEYLKTVFSVEEELEKLTQEEEKVKDSLRQKALKLSQVRTQAAKKLQDAVDKEIQALNMPHASFSVNFAKGVDDPAESFGPKGIDEIEFYLTANKGEESRPLSKVASGGELSRIILALKNVLSLTGSVSSIIFDEVDNGIGGAVAEIVGRKLKEVSANHQVVCITHLPQIACFGDKHMYVSKKVVKGRTVTFLEELDREQKIEEISRMLGGVNVTQKTREHAREMLNSSR